MEIKEFILFLKSGEEKYKVKYKTDDGYVCSNPYSYSDKIYNFLDYWSNSKYNKIDYLDKYKEYINKEVKDMNYEDICNNVTYIFRRERFNAGCIKENLKRLEKLLERLSKLIKKA